MKRSKLIVSLLMTVLLQNSFAQLKKTAYKSFHEKSYAKDDIILCPVIIYYDARLDERGKDSIKIIADFLISHPTLIVEVGVYTDQRGNNSYNKKLSEMRAKCIVDYLNQNFTISYDRMKSFGYGEEFPIYTQGEIDNATGNKMAQEEMYTKNRRTEIKILSVK